MKTVKRSLDSQRGLGLITVIVTMGLVLALATTLGVRMQLDTRGQVSFRTTPQNLSVAEAGIGQGNAQFRNIFVNGNVPVGTTGNPPTTNGTGDYALQSGALAGQAIRYELTVPSGVTNPSTKRLPPGVQFGGLNVSQSLYTVISGTPDLVNPTAQLRSEFQISDIPTFQFLAFYNGQLDISPADDINLHGRIHTNSNLYLDNSGDTLTIAPLSPNIPTVEVSASGSIYRQRSDGGGCNGTVQIADNSGTLRTLTCAQGPQVSSTTLANWGGTLSSGVQNINMPASFSKARLSSQGYWASADVRIVLNLGTTYSQTRGTGGSAVTVPLYQIEVENGDGTVDATKTASLRTFMHSSPGSIFYNDVPLTANNGSTLCTTSSTATSYVTPSYAAPSCAATDVDDRRRYNPAFQGDTYVYRRADAACRASPTSSSCSSGNPGLWALTSTTSGDQLGNGASSAIGDYRRGGFYNNRENKWIYMLNVDLQQLLTWNLSFGAGAYPLFDPTVSSQGGTVIFLSVVGSNSTGINNYGVRVFDSAQLPGYPLSGQNPLGITVASDQAFYIQGNYNTFAYSPTNTGPTGIPWTHPSAGLVGDTMNVLSSAWESTVSSISNDQKSATDLGSSTARTAADTTIYAAFEAGVDNPATSTNNYNGGLQNYPRLHELWGDGTYTLTIRGSLVSLTTPVHQNGQWYMNGTSYNMYNVPVRDWDFDPQLADLAMLPPMTPSFIYVNQIVIAEDFR